MDKVKIVAKTLLLTLVLLVVATLPLQIAIIITSLVSMFDVNHITLYQPLALALGLMGEGFVLFVLRQEFKGNKARLQQVMPFDKKGALIRYGTGYVLGTITFALLGIQDSAFLRELVPADIPPSGKSALCRSQWRLARRPRRRTDGL